MKFINLVLCAGVVAFSSAYGQNTTVELKKILVSDTLDLLLNGSKTGKMTGGFVLKDSSIITQHTLSVNQNGQNVVKLLENREYKINSGVLTRVYQKMDSPSGSSIWELEQKKGIWELIVTTAGVRNTRTISSVYEHLNGTLGLYKGINNKSIHSGDFWVDTLIELTSGENIYATTRCKEVPSETNRYRWIFTVVNSLQGKEERWELDTNGNTLYHENAPFTAVKHGFSPLNSSDNSSGSENLFAAFTVKAPKPPAAGERMTVVLDSTVRIDSSVINMYEKSELTKYLLKHTKCSCNTLSTTKNADSLNVYLKATATLQVDHPEIKTLAQKLSQQHKSVCDKIAGYTSYVAASIQDRNTATFSSALETLRAGFGDCGEHAVLLAALLRASGIPARVMLGLVYMESLKVYYGHAWVMAFDGSDWVFADPAHNVFPACTKRVPLLIDDSGQQMIKIIKMLGKISIE